MKPAAPEPMKPAAAKPKAPEPMRREPAKPSAAAEAARSAAALRATEEEPPTTIGDPPATTKNGAAKATSDIPAGEELAVVVEDEPTIESRLTTEKAPRGASPADLLATTVMPATPGPIDDEVTAEAPTTREQPTSDSDAGEVTAAISSSEIAALSGHPVPAGEVPPPGEQSPEPTGPWAAPHTGRSGLGLPKRLPGTNRLESPGDAVVPVPLTGNPSPEPTAGPGRTGTPPPRRFAYPDERRVKPPGGQPTPPGRSGQPAPPPTGFPNSPAPAALNRPPGTREPTFPVSDPPTTREPAGPRRDPANVRASISPAPYPPAEPPTTREPAGVRANISPAPFAPAEPPTTRDPVSPRASSGPPAPSGLAKPSAPSDPESTEESRPQQTPNSSALDAWRDTDLLTLPLPPAPPGERGYRPGDVQRLVGLLADAIADVENGPRPDEVAGLKLSRTFFIGQGYHIGAVEALRAAWVSELKRREL